MLLQTLCRSTFELTFHVYFCFSMFSIAMLSFTDKNVSKVTTLAEATAKSQLPAALLLLKTQA